MNTIQRGGAGVSYPFDLEPVINAIAELKESITMLQQMEDDRVPLSETVAYDIAYPSRDLGFIIVRHVNSKQTDYYWKECYTCIRKWYDNPIIIIDDSSNFEYLNDNLKLVNCHIIYDTEHKGCGELLGYYYYHLLKPFESAIILHDSVFIQKYVDFSLRDANMQFLWTFNSAWDKDLENYYKELCAPMPLCEEILAFYQQRQFRGCFGLMSVIKWDFLDLLVEDGLLLSLGQIKGRRDARSALERILGFMAFRRDPTIQARWGEIHSYIRWGTTFLEYLGSGIGVVGGIHSDDKLDIVKVWTGR